MTNKKNSQIDFESYLANYLLETIRISKHVDKKAVGKILDALFKAWREEKNVFLAGNGGSATIAMHFTTDLGKGTYSDGKPRLHTFCLSENPDLISALVNDNGWDNLYIDQLRGLIKRGDVFIAFSVHGGSGEDKAGSWSQNLLKAMDYAKKIGAATVGFSGFDGGPMKDLADISLVIPAYKTGHVQDFHFAIMHVVSDLLGKKIASFKK